MEKENTGKILHFMDRIEGDKVVWTILLFLCMISLVCIFSSTSQLTTATNSRLDIVKDQVITIGLGLAAIFICYRINALKWFKMLSRWGFALSAFLLVFIDLHIKTPFLSAAAINDAWRIIKVGGFQVHVLEVVKVAMVMYLAWAIDRLKDTEKGYPLIDRLRERKGLHWLGGKDIPETLYVILPTLLISALALPASNSAAVFLAAIMFLAILLGGVRFSHVFRVGLLAVILFAALFGVNRLSVKLAGDHPDRIILKRIGTGVSRVLDKSVDYEEVIRTSPKNSREYQNALDRIRQPYGAKIAIQEGGLIGKGPGNSTQKYKVPVMYEDYIFSFIIEEYGLLGGIFIIFLYISLLARGAIIARNCNDHFAKTAVAGLCMMITAQAMMHILVNCDVGILTGQTLPLISYGTSAFLCFSIAFGIILSISRMAEKNVEKERIHTKPLIELEEIEGDDVRAGLQDLDAMEAIGLDTTDLEIPEGEQGGEDHGI